MKQNRTTWESSSKKNLCLHNGSSHTKGMIKECHWWQDGKDAIQGVPNRKLMPTVKRACCYLANYRIRGREAERCRIAQHHLQEFAKNRQTEVNMRQCFGRSIGGRSESYTRSDVCDSMIDDLLGTWWCVMRWFLMWWRVPLFLMWSSMVGCNVYITVYICAVFL